MEGVLKSWAVPKGPSADPAQKRLSIMVDDHPLSYGSFEGVIDEGQYGAGKVVIWDRGDYKLISGSISKGKLEFSLYGGKLKGAYVLLRLKGKEKEWLLIKKKDEFAEPGFKLKTIL
jgi:bifunctional non-homologous end joining protein LigD